LRLALGALLCVLLVLLLLLGQLALALFKRIIRLRHGSPWKSTRAQCNPPPLTRPGRPGEEGSADLDAGLAGTDLADDRGVGKPLRMEHIQHLAERLRRAGHQQSARGLRVGQQVPGGPVDAGAKRDRLAAGRPVARSEEHTSELQSRENLVCRLLLENKKAC